jgi:MFS family permease
LKARDAWALRGVAAAAGIAYTNLAVALPLLVLALGHSTGTAGAFLALNTVAFVCGALLGRPVVPRLGLGGTLSLALIALTGGGATALVVGGLPGLVAGGLANGIGMGLFWVGAQGILGRRSGSQDSERAFVGLYVAYVAGTVAGGALTGMLAAVFGSLGLDRSTSIRLTFTLAVAAALTALVPWLAVSTRVDALRARGGWPPFRLALGFRIQAPDFFIVSAMGMVLNLAPAVLAKSFGLSSFEIGSTVAGTALAKIGGSLLAGRLVRSLPVRRLLVLMLAGAAALALLLASSDDPVVFVLLLFGTTVLGLGVWPLLVDAAQARVDTSQRESLTVIWNVREYLVIAAATGCAGLLLDAFRPGITFALAAVLLAAAAIAAAPALARPVRAPEPA